MTDRTAILNYLKVHKAELLARYHLSKIGLFGSIARGEGHPGSDIDLIVEFQEGTENLSQLKRSLKELMETTFQMEVDICRKKYIKSYYRNRILADAVFV